MYTTPHSVLTVKALSPPALIRQRGCGHSNGTEHFTLRGRTDYVNSAVYSPDGKSILTASRDGTAKVSNVSPVTLTQPRLTLYGHTGPVWKVAYSPNGKTVLTTSGDGTAKIWEYSDWAGPAHFTGP